MLSSYDPLYVMSKLRVIGVDYGQKRVGVAISDPLGLFAQPLGTYDPSTALSEIQAVQKRDGIESIVIGWPQLPDGSEGLSVENVKLFQKRIEKVIHGVPVIRWNEEFTSEIAKELISRGEKPSLRRTGRGRIDAAAAAVILQEYLDQLQDD